LINQREQLAAAGCLRIFAEKVTGTRRDRPELARLLDPLRPGAIPPRPAEHCRVRARADP